VKERRKSKKDHKSHEKNKKNFSLEGEEEKNEWN
jgi:hypothetical protein